MNNSRYLFSIIVIILCGSCARIYNSVPTVGNDDERWCQTSSDFLKTKSEQHLSVYHGRILFRATLNQWGRLFGYSPSNARWLMLLLFILSTMSIATLSKQALGKIASLWTAIFYSSHPLLITYDLMAFPDGLAIALHSLSLLFFFRYLHDDNTKHLIFCGLLIGLSAHAKEYYGVMCVPFTLSLLTQRKWSSKFARTILTFSLSVLIGFSSGLILYAIDNQPVLEVFSAVSDYGEFHNHRTEHHGVGWQRFLTATTERFQYGRVLFMKMGIATGFLTLASLIYSTFNITKANVFRTPLSIATFFILFLSFFPTSFSPFTYTELQPRYLGILIPSISVIFGGFFSNLLVAIRFQRLSRTIALTTIICLLSNIVLTNDYGSPVFSRYNATQADALARELSTKKYTGWTLFTTSLKSTTALSRLTREHGISIDHITVESDKSSENKYQNLRDLDKSIFFIRRKNRNQLEYKMVAGNYSTGDDIADGDATCAEKLRQAGYSIIPLFGFSTVTSRLKSHLIPSVKGTELVGWLYAKSEN